VERFHALKQKGAMEFASLSAGATTEHRLMQKICIHWTAGSYRQSAEDFRHYHFTVDETGEIHAGQFPPESNCPPLQNGRYAAHCGGGNSNCIGIALQGMAGYQTPNHPGRYPLTRPQAEAAWSLTARLCQDYGIDITPDTVFTHYEFGRRHPDSDSRGKIDITFLPFSPLLKADEVGDYIRQKVQWYQQKLGVRRA
jgi:hypothetical protein